MNTNHLLARGDRLSAPGAVDLTRIDWGLVSWRFLSCLSLCFIRMLSLRASVNVSSIWSSSSVILKLTFFAFFGGWSLGRSSSSDFRISSMIWRNEEQECNWTVIMMKIINIIIKKERRPTSVQQRYDILIDASPVVLRGGSILVKEQKGFCEC